MRKTGLAVLDCCNVASNSSPALKNLVGVIKYDAPLFGQHQFACNPFEQCKAKALFELADLH